MSIAAYETLHEDSPSLLVHEDDAVSFDPVQRASEESFPASDPPSWIAKAPKEPVRHHCATLRAKTAIDFMSTNVNPIRGDASLLEASSLLTDKGYHSVPVVDEAGKPIGVISQYNLLMHARESLKALSAKLGLGAPDENPAAANLFTAAPKTETAAETNGIVLVRDIMIPAVFTIPADAPAEKVVEQFKAMRIHQLCVVDENGALMAAICPLDVLKHLDLDDMD